MMLNSARSIQVCFQFLIPADKVNRTFLCGCASLLYPVLKYIYTFHPLPPLQAHHFTHDTVCHLDRTDKDEHIEYQFPDIAPHHRDRSRIGLTTGGEAANTEKIMQTSTMIAPSRHTAQ